MAAQGYFLTEGDRSAINDVLRLIREHGSEILAQPQHHQPDSQDLTGTTQCYIARTPYGINGDGVGIPALTRAGDDELRFRERDQGFIFHNKSDIPGRALCDIYRIIRGGEPLAYRLVPLPLVAQWVYNLSGSTIAENEWVTIVREKAGSWTVTGLVGGGDGMFWASLSPAGECSEGRYTATEVVPGAGATWVTRAGGIVSDYAYHEDKHLFASGGPLISPGTVRLIRRGFVGPPQEYIFGGPAGATGTAQRLADWICCTSGVFQGQGRKLIEYEQWFNGNLIRLPCHVQNIGVCETCPQPPPNPCS